MSVFLRVSRALINASVTLHLWLLAALVKLSARAEAKADRRHATHLLVVTEAQTRLTAARDARDAAKIAARNAALSSRVTRVAANEEAARFRPGAVIA